MDGKGSASIEFIPVLMEDEENLLDGVLAAPFSYVSTEGPVWRTAAMRRRIIEDERKSHVLVRQESQVIGAVSWSAGQTPGYFRLILTSSSDEAWSPGTADEAVRAALSMLLRAAEVKRVELLVATYNEVLLKYLTEYSGFIVEGVLRDRFFIDGEFWPGIMCRADLTTFVQRGERVPESRAELLSSLRKKTLEDLTAAHDGTSWSA
ncbi:GNAT family N-acetyltransferase [Streptomyces sp. NPDC004296]|uniref:GNAT family N-acetyltransferase n=1 Tax=Streptomyces sp. NPDC004296 TaxID=3364697 RepID=UPI0036A177BA